MEMLMNKYAKHDKIFEGWSPKELFIANEIINEDKIFDEYPPKELSIAEQMIKFLKKKNISLELFDSYIRDTKERSRTIMKLAEKEYSIRQKVWQEKAPKCSECGELMNLFPINVNRSTIIEDKTIKSTWLCSNEKDCGNQLYNKDPAEYYLEEVLDKVDLLISKEDEIIVG